MLVVRNLNKRYERQKFEAVRDVNFELDAGKFLAIIGRSGSGKSTLLGMIGGISRPTGGSVSVAAVEEWTLDDSARADFRNRQIGFVFQFASLIPTLRAIDNVALPALIGGALLTPTAYTRARTLLERVGLSEKVDSYPGQLSGGEQRRAAIARALINSPALLLADEPTADLDEETEQEILELLINIQRLYGFTMIVVTHNPAIARRANRIMEMRKGEATEKRSAVVETEPLNPSLPLPLEPLVAERARVYDPPASSALKQPVLLGKGVDQFIGSLVKWVAPFVFLAWASNWGAAWYQRSLIEARIAARSALEQLAMTGLRADLQDIVFGPDNSYIVTIYLRNTTGGDPIYIMGPTLRAFVQVGGGWQEVPLRTIDQSGSRVVKITGTQTYQFVLQPDVKEFEQLLPYYMHVRLSNEMLVSGSAQPKDDLIPRSDNYYVYLKPQNADDAAILQKLHFDGKPPVWIPMPPH